MKILIGSKLYLVKWKHIDTDEYKEWNKLMWCMENICKHNYFFPRDIKVRNPQSRKLTLCHIIDGDTKQIVHIGTAQCSFKDQFVKHKGRCISLERAMKNFSFDMKQSFIRQYIVETNKPWYDYAQMRNL